MSFFRLKSPGKSVNVIVLIEKTFFLVLPLVASMSQSVLSLDESKTDLRGLVRTGLV